MSELQVNAGEVQIGSSGASCTATNAGAIRYASGTAYGNEIVCFMLNPAVAVLASG